jgi:hypothetical protein
MKNLTGITAILVLIIVGLACKDGFETEKANGIIAEANKFITTANENADKASKKYDEFTKKVDDIDSDNDLKDARNFGKDELFPLYEAMSENFKKAGEKFEEASRLKVHEKYKEYLETKAKELKIRSEYALERKKIPQALIDSKKKKEYEEDRDKIKENADKILKEAKELDEKAEQIRRDNPKIIK